MSFQHNSMEGIKLVCSIAQGPICQSYLQVYLSTLILRLKQSLKLGTPCTVIVIQMPYVKRKSVMYS